MNKKMMRTIAISMILVTSVGFLAGCGSTQQVGYVDVAKIASDTTKGQEIDKNLQAKNQELMQKLQQVAAAGDEAATAQVQQASEQEFYNYRVAQNKEFKTAVENATAEIAKEKKLDVVFQKAAVVNGGVDVTDDVINKLGKAATTGTDTATTAATK